MKTIEEAAIDNCGCSKMDCRHCFEHERMDECSYYKKKESFEEGAEFVQRWISVDEELPETIKTELGISYSDYVLIKVNGYEHPFVGYYVNACDDEFFDFISESTSKIIKQTDITHWRPVEYNN